MRETYSWLIKDGSSFFVCETCNILDFCFVVVNPWKLLHYWAPTSGEREAAPLDARAASGSENSDHFVMCRSLNLSFISPTLGVVANSAAWIKHGRSFMLAAVAGTHTRLLWARRWHGAGASLLIRPSYGTRVKRGHDGDGDWPLVCPLINYTLGELRINEWKAQLWSSAVTENEGKGDLEEKRSAFFPLLGGQITNYKVFVFLCNRYVTENRL